MTDPAHAPVKRSGTTTAAAIVVFVISAVYVALGVALVVLGIIVANAGPDEEVIGDSWDFLGSLSIVAGLIVLALCAWTIATGVGLLRRQRWAWIGGIVTFGIITGLMALIVLASVSGGNPEAYSTVNLVGLAAALVLLVVPPTRADFPAPAYRPPAGYATPIPPPPPPPPPPDLTRF